MRAVRYDRYGPADLLQIAAIPEPIPAARELSVRIEAASLNPLDWKLREGTLRFVPLSKSPPRTTGTDFAGVIVAVGGAEGPWQVGQRVFGSLSPFGREGSCAERCVVGADRLATISDSVSFETAACLPIAAGEAVQALADDAKLASGHNVLVIGAAGGVGHFAVQYARHVDARVTGVCGPANLAFVEGLGADEVIDYHATDILRLGPKFDVVFDVAAVIDWRTSQQLLKRGGVYLSTAGSALAAMSTAVGGLLAPLLGGTRARNVNLRMGSAALGRLVDLAAAGVVKPHIASRIGLEDVARVQAAMQRGHGRGKIVVLPQGGVA
jgi:NADPH:quinone reductase-like Zn-dependent oxidoreductase